MGVHCDSGLLSSASASVLHCNAIFSFVVVVLCVLGGGVGGGSSCGLGYSFFFSFLWGEDGMVDELCK